MEHRLRISLVRVRSPRRVLVVRVCELAALVGLASVAPEVAAQSTSARATAVLVGTLFWCGMFAAHHIACVAVESGLVPRALVLRTRRAGRVGTLRIVTWRSLLGAGACTVDEADVPLKMCYFTGKRERFHAGTRVELVVGERRRSAQLTIISDLEDAADAAEDVVRRVQRAFARAGVPTVLVAPELPGSSGAVRDQVGSLRSPKDGGA